MARPSTSESTSSQVAVSTDMADFDIIDVTPENLSKYDLFCKKSKKKEEGYRNKVRWFKEQAFRNLLSEHGID